MIYGLHQSAAGMMVQEHRQDVIANNLANAETHGFKRQMAVFAERIRADQAGRRSGPSNELLRELTGGVWLARTETDHSDANFITTGHETDVALAGPGYFTVLKDGREMLTRDGRFVVAPNGALVSATDGAAVLGAGGAPLRIDPRGGPISIDEDGEIQQRDVAVGRLALTDVVDRAALRHAGGGRFEAGGIERTPAIASVTSGALEASGVEPVVELTQLLEAARAYQLNAQMLTAQDQSVGRLIGFLAAA